MHLKGALFNSFMKIMFTQAVENKALQAKYLLTTQAFSLFQISKHPITN